MKKKIIIGIVSIIALLILLNCKYSLAENEYGLVKEFGKVVSVQKNAGLHLKKPFIQTVKKIAKENQLYDLAPSDVITSDKKTMIADCYVIWRISDPLKYFQTLNSKPNAEGRIDATVYSEMKNVISSLEQEKLIQGKDGTLSNTIMERLKENSMEEEYGISIEVVDIKVLDLPQDNKEAVYARMISEREKIATQYKAEGEANAKQISNNVDYEVRIILSNAEKESKNIIAEGESEYMKIIQEAYGGDDLEKKEFYQFLRGLEATKASLSKGTTIIIDDEYPIIDNMKLEAEEETQNPTLDIITE